MPELQQILKQNPDMLLSKKKTRGLLSDIFQGDPAKVNLMMSAYDIGVISSLRNSCPMTSFEQSRLSMLLVQQYSVVEDKAAWAIETWNKSITKSIIAALSKAELEAERQDKEETRQVEEAKKSERKKADAETAADLMHTRDDYDSYYINPTLDEQNDRVYIPCGVGNTDNGFFINGIKKAMQCNHPDANIYVLIYNYLVRNSKITDEDIPLYLKSMDTTYELDYRSIFRFCMILLQLIKNNYTDSSVLEIALPTGEDKESLKYAVKLINNYSDLFCRLIKTETVVLQVKLSSKGTVISLNSSKGICVTDNSEIVSNAREMWYGRKIIYRLTLENLQDIEYILGEISPFIGFKEGQYDALCSMLNSKKHAVCIMPTGSGKSLIYYLASLLQPLPLFVVAPTEILISDQIRNLKKFHRFDNVAHLQLTDDNSFSDYDVHNSLNYITPMTFQNRHLLVKFRYINKGTTRIGTGEGRIASGPLLSYVVLDEIHCISNWGHDFRPEYLMLSRFLNKFLDQITFWGFTATADYTVVEDIQRQISIPPENFYSPIPFEKENISYNYRRVGTTEEMYEALSEITNHLLEENHRTIIFTKNDEISNKVADVVGYEADIFSADNPSAYHHFVDGKCKILIASEELGVGINFPNITSIVHFGLPLSKCEYVQEVGRAGRANEKVDSYVIYMSKSTVPQALLERSTSIDDLPKYLSETSNDFTQCYDKLTNHCPTMDVLYNQLIEVYKKYESSDKCQYVTPYKPDEIELVKQQLYMLFTVGYVNDWYSYGRDKNGVHILIDLYSSDTDSYRFDDSKMTRRMKERLSNYFEFLGNDREGIAKTNRAKTREEIIKVYVEWYYSKYLYHHHEQFIDLFEFIDRNIETMDAEVTSEIKDYFMLPFTKLKSDEVYYNDLTLTQIREKAIIGINLATLANIERINSNRYNTKLDFLLFCVHLKSNQVLEESRLERIIGRLSENEKMIVLDSLEEIYASCDINTRLSIINYISGSRNCLKISLNNFLDEAYKRSDKDVIYYGILAKRINKILVDFQRSADSSVTNAQQAFESPFKKRVITSPFTQPYSDKGSTQADPSLEQRFVESKEESTALTQLSSTKNDERIEKLTEMVEAISKAVSSNSEQLKIFQSKLIDAQNAETDTQEIESTLAKLASENNELQIQRQKLIDENALIQQQVRQTRAEKEDLQRVIDEQNDLQSIQKKYEFTDEYLKILKKFKRLIIIDTCTLMNHQEIFDYISESEAIRIPKIVREELDRHKQHYQFDNERGRKAQKAIVALKNAKFDSEGIIGRYCEEDSCIELIPSDYDSDNPDNRILSVAIRYARYSDVEVILVSGDENCYGRAFGEDRIIGLHSDEFLFERTQHHKNENSITEQRAASTTWTYDENEKKNGFLDRPINASFGLSSKEVALLAQYGIRTFRDFLSQSTEQLSTIKSKSSINFSAHFLQVQKSIISKMNK